MPFSNVDGYSYFCWVKIVCIYQLINWSFSFRLIPWWESRKLSRIVQRRYMTKCNVLDMIRLSIHAVAVHDHRKRSGLRAFMKAMHRYPTKRTGFLSHRLWTTIFQTNRIYPKLVFPHFNTACILLAEHQSEYYTFNKFLVLLKRIWTLSPFCIVQGSGSYRRLFILLCRGSHW